MVAQGSPLRDQHHMPETQHIDGSTSHTANTRMERHSDYDLQSVRFDERFRALQLQVQRQQARKHLRACVHFYKRSKEAHHMYDRFNYLFKCSAYCCWHRALHQNIWSAHRLQKRRSRFTKQVCIRSWRYALQEQSQLLRSFRTVEARTSVNLLVHCVSCWNKITARSRITQLQQNLHAQDRERVQQDHQLQLKDTELHELRAQLDMVSSQKDALLHELETMRISAPIASSGRVNLHAKVFQIQNEQQLGRFCKPLVNMTASGTAQLLLLDCCSTFAPGNQEQLYVWCTSLDFKQSFHRSDTLVWKNANPTDRIHTGPQPRADFSACSINGAVAVFGGYDGAREHNDLWIGDVFEVSSTCSSIEWSCANVDGPLQSRSHAAMTSLSLQKDTAIALFGGFNSSEGCLNVLTLLQGSKTGGNYRYVSREPEQVGFLPCKRRSCGIAANGNTLVVFGGVDNGGQLVSARLFGCDVNTFSWIELDVYAMHKPERRSLPAMALTSHCDVILMGGWSEQSCALHDLWIFSKTHSFWSMLEMSTHVLGSRADVALLDSTSDHSLVLTEDCICLLTWPDSYNIEQLQDRTNDLRKTLEHERMYLMQERKARKEIEQEHFQLKDASVELLDAVEKEIDAYSKREAQLRAKLKHCRENGVKCIRELAESTAKEISVQTQSQEVNATDTGTQVAMHADTTRDIGVQAKLEDGVHEHLDQEKKLRMQHEWQLQNERHARREAEEKQAQAEASYNEALRSRDAAVEEARHANDRLEQVLDDESRAIVSTRATSGTYENKRLNVNDENANDDEIEIERIVKGA